MADEFIIVCGSLGFFFLIFAFFAFMRYLSYRETLALAEKGLMRGQIRSESKSSLRWGIALTAVGLALFLGLWPIGLFSGSRWPLGLGPWMLAGLLPMFFGLGLVLIYYLTAREEEKEDTKPPAE